ncbi:MAG: DedA family protein [Acidobacteria bacterium]|nr:DedA family protein [Acidobacteriota bacterium]
MTIHPIALVKKLGVYLAAFMAPFGIWGLAGLSFIDAAFIPLPTTMDGTVWFYVDTYPHNRFLLVCLVAAVASALGSLVPYYIGRGGGELFLLKKINRERYERMRDKFEKQEYLAIMIPAMLPPPTPIKLFEFAAGVFEMKPLPYLLAIFCGKYLQFSVMSLALILFGPKILDIGRSLMHEHAGMMWTIGGIGLVAISVYMLRKVFARRRGVKFPIEDADTASAEE